MIINQGSLAAMYRGFNTIFQKAFDAAEVMWSRLATNVPSTGRDEQYTWLGQVPGMKEWIGDKQVKSVAAHDYTIKNKDWEDTIEVDRNDIQDDKLGLYAPLVQMLAQAAKEHPDELMEILLNGAFTMTCYDGQYFCDTDHPYDAGVISNKSTLALSAANYATGRAAMRIIKGDEGRMLRINPRLLVVAPNLEGTARQIVTAEKDAAGADNIWYKSAEVLVLPGLTAGYWFLVDDSKAIKPLILQMRQAAQSVQQTDPQSDNVFMRKKFRYGAEARYNMGYGLWQLIWGSTGTGA